MAKKIISFLICISLLFVSVVSVAQSTRISSDDTYSRSASFICGLGIAEEQNFECDSEHTPVTRAEMAEFVILLLGIDKSGYGFVQNFTDVTQITESCVEIHICHSLGIISGYDDHTFRPDNPVSVTDALKIIVSALGYDIIAMSKGGYPSGYMAVAAELGLTKDTGLLSDGNLCKHVMAQIFENALFSPVAVKDINADRFNIQKDATVLFLRHGIVEDSGTVTGNEYCTLTSKNGVGDKKIMIDETVLNNPRGLEPDLGSKITYYYKINDNNKPCEFLYFYDDSESVINLDAGQIVDYENNILRYVSKNTVHQKQIARDSDVIYNNSPLTVLSEKYLTPESGSLTLIDNDGDGIIDVVICKSYENYVVQSVDPDNGIIFDRYDNNKTLTIIDGDENCSLRDKDGILVSVSSLTLWDVVTAYVSDDGKIADAYVTTKELEGAPTEIGEEDGRRYMIMNDKKYYISQSYTGNLIIGENSLFYQDKFGDIAAVRSIRDSEFEFGYLIDSKASENSMSNDILLQILSIKGFVDVYTCSKHLYTDDTIKKTKDEKLSALSAMNDEVIWYSLDKDGSIDKIYSPRSNAFSKTWSSLKNEDGTKIASPEQITYRTSAKILGGKVTVDENTKVFLIPDNGDKDLYRVGSPNFTDGLSYSLDAYKLNDETIVSDVLVQYYNGISSPINGVSPILVIDDISVIYNDNGEPIQRVTGYINGYYASYETTDDSVLDHLTPFTKNGNYYKGEKGDMIRFARDSEGKIREAEIIYKAKTDTLFSSNPNSTNYFQGTRVSYSQVYKSNGGFMMLTPGVLNAYENQPGLEIYNVSQSSVCRYDTKKQEVSAATGNDIRGFTDVGKNASKVIVWTISANPSTIYIID